MSGYRFARAGGEWSQTAWRALDRAVYRWVRVHGGSAALAATAAWASLADGNGDAALPLADGGRLGMPPLSGSEIEALRGEPMVSRADGAMARPFVIDASERFFLWRNFVLEREAAAAIQRRRHPVVAIVGADAAIEADLDVLFHGARGSEVSAQRAAVRGVVGQRLFVLTGGPGTGKTTTVLRMLLLLQRRASRPLSIRMAAPTGKAAQRLAQALRQGKAALCAHPDAPLPADWQPLLAAIPDSDASTVHRLLGFEPWRNSFCRNARDPIDADVVVVDEASMVDLTMLRSLLDAVKPDASLLLVGDADQLTSIATGSVLMDLVAALDAGAGGELVRLRHSFRAHPQLFALNEAVRIGAIDAVTAAFEAGGELQLRSVSEPRQLAAQVAQWSKHLAAEEGLRAPPDAESSAHDSAATGDAQQLAARTALAALAKRQLLCALREGPFGALAVSGALERLLRRAWNVAENAEWYAGRAVIITRNDYACGLFNGDVGVCLADSTGLKVWFDSARGTGNGAAATVRAFSPNALPAHESAFAITIHKSQGSEYDSVAVLLPPDPDNRILSRQLLYTAVSRARRNVQLWTTDAALRAALSRPIERQGGLRERLSI